MAELLKLKPDAANPDRMVVMITFERPETLDLFRRHAGDLQYVPAWTRRS